VPSLLPTRLAPVERLDSPRWLASARTQRLLALCREALAVRLPEVFGREIVQIGGVGEQPLLDAAVTQYRSLLAPPRTPGAAVWVEPEHLPLPEASVDAVLLPFLLERCRSPHQVLREVDRVLNDRGRLFVLGFNPWSGWALRARLGWLPGGSPSFQRFPGARRLEDWLSLLDYEITEIHRFGPGFPWLAPRSDGVGPWLRRLGQPFQEVFLLSARKRRLLVNRLPRPVRAQVRPLVGVPVARRESGSPEAPLPPTA
jgi:SAM-dependent methyltransferase